MSGIFWIASYPKSGSTWLRAFLTNLMREAGEPAGIDDLVGEGAGARALFEEATGHDSSELTTEEILRLRPEVYRHLARNSKQVLFLKVHDACGPELPRDVTLGAWYVIRNPLDVCVSFAHHAGDRGFDRTIGEMGRGDCVLNADGMAWPGQFPQQVLSWSGHVRSWVDAPALRVQVVRYEDMAEHAGKTFRAVAAFARLPEDGARLARAVANSSFAEMRRQEARGGFRERPPGVPDFFRRGEAGGWRRVLSESQAQRILSDHGDVMRRFGYVDDRGNPLF